MSRLRLTSTGRLGLGPPRGWPFNDFLQPTPRLAEPPGGEGKDSGTTAGGRTLRSWRRRGRGDEQVCQPERSGGNPKGWRTRAAPRPLRSTRAASKEAPPSERKATWRVRAGVSPRTRWQLVPVIGAVPKHLRRRGPCCGDRLGDTFFDRPAIAFVGAAVLPAREPAASLGHGQPPGASESLVLVLAGVNSSRSALSASVLWVRVGAAPTSKAPSAVARRSARAIGAPDQGSTWVAFDAATAPTVLVALPSGSGPGRLQSLGSWLACRAGDQDGWRAHSLPEPRVMASLSGLLRIEQTVCLPSSQPSLMSPARRPGRNRRHSAPGLGQPEPQSAACVRDLRCYAPASRRRSHAPRGGCRRPRVREEELIRAGASQQRCSTIATGGLRDHDAARGRQRARHATPAGSWARRLADRSLPTPHLCFEPAQLARQVILFASRRSGW
jgi:hypothetical protein